MLKGKCTIKIIFTSPNYNYLQLATHTTCTYIIEGHTYASSSYNYHNLKGIIVVSFPVLFMPWEPGNESRYYILYFELSSLLTQTHRHTDRQTDTDTQTDTHTQTDRHTQTDIQTDTHTHTHTLNPETIMILQSTCNFKLDYKTTC